MSWFAQHGTKALGTLTAAVGMVSAINPATVPPSWAPWLLAISGLATVARGFQNTANQELPPPVMK